VLTSEVDVRKLVHIQAFSPREFLQTVILHELPKSTGKRSFITISIPRVGNIENPSNAKGVYTAIDAVTEVGDGKVEIITAISVSSPRLSLGPCPLRSGECGVRGKISR
jgi:hypothetical protein